MAVRSGTTELRNLVVGVAEVCAYQGFSPSMTRQVILESGMSLQDLVQILTMTVFVGNNPDRLHDKVADPSKTSELTRKLIKYHIQRSATDPKTLTLPRIAAAYAPVLLAIRRILKSEGKLPLANVSTSTPLELCSVSLACMVLMQPEIKDFLLKFGRAIKPARETDEQSDVKSMQYALIAANAATADPLMSPQNFSESANLQSLLFAAGFKSP